MSVPETERLVMTMGDIRIQMALREMRMEDLIGLMHFMPGEARSRIDANLSARVSREVAKVLEKGPPEGAGEGFDRAEAILGAFAERDIGSLARDGDDEVAAGLDGRDPARFAKAFGELAGLARAEGIGRATVEALAAGNVHPLAAAGLALLGSTRDPEAFEECLESMAERHLAEERVRVEVAREGLLAIFYGRGAEETALRCSCKVPFAPLPADS